MAVYNETVAPRSPQFTLLCGYADVTPLPPLPIASHFQGSLFYRNTSEHLLLPFDKMKLHPWEFLTHCSLGYFTPVLFHYLLIFQRHSAWL